MRTWANSGLTNSRLANAALTGAMLALGRTSPPATGSDSGVGSRPSHRGSAGHTGRRELPEPMRSPDSERLALGELDEPRSGQFPRYPASQGWPVTDAPGSDRPVNPTDGFLAGDVAALAASSVPSSVRSWEADAGAIGSWGTSAPLTPVPVVPPPPLAEMTQVSELTRITDRTPAPEPTTMSDAPGSEFAASGSLDAGQLDAGSVAAGSLAAGPLGPGPDHGEPAPLPDSSALGSLDSSGLFGALAQRPR
ncbi:MAG: hypothetical protein ACT4O0_00075 [Pseudonocardia sp.]